jgi:hypothetical protein
LQDYEEDYAGKVLMKAYIDSYGRLVVKAAEETENYALAQWVERAKKENTGEIVIESTKRYLGRLANIDG